MCIIQSVRDYSKRYNRRFGDLLADWSNKKSCRKAVRKEVRVWQSLILQQSSEIIDRVVDFSGNKKVDG
ncbi:hypothetical protein CRI87_06720 [Liquorilactobacillus satsumensis]|nr:hypothetical protein [Liquorilactobacillus satsumensis]